MKHENLTPIQSIMHWFSLAGERERFEGTTWYQEANQFARYLADTYHLDTLTTSHLIAVFSPQLGWGENKIRVEKFIVIYKNKGNVYKNGLGFHANIDKAVKIIKGDLSALRGPKVNAFAWGIYKNGFTERVCVDRHAKRVANFGSENTPSQKQYYQIEGAYQIATAEINRQLGTQYTPCQIQAITWVTFRRNKGLDSQYD